MFEFDPAKSAANLAKHGIDFEQAQALWADPHALRVRVPRPDLSEDRWLVIGLIGDRLWTAVVTYRDAATRIISVRRARDQEAKHYGEAD